MQHETLEKEVVEEKMHQKVEPARIDIPRHIFHGF